MKVNILFFGAAADAAGMREMELAIEPGARADELLASLLSRFPKLGDHKILFAVNQEYSDGHTPVAEGDELAVFTAVSGG